MKSSVFFSIIIPSYNRASLIIDTIASFQSQTYGNFEVIIVDDGSTDNTESVVEKICSQDGRIRYFKKENGERGAARNYGIKLAKGQYITFIDSDDIAYPWALEVAQQQIREKNFPYIISLSYEFRDIPTLYNIEKKESFFCEIVNEDILQGNILGCIGVFVKRDVLEKFSFEENRKFAGTEDWLFWLQLAACYSIYRCNLTSFCMRQHDNRSVMNFSEEELNFRAQFIRDALEKDANFIKAFGVKMPIKIYGHMLTYAGLHLAMKGLKRKALLYYIRGLKYNPQEIIKKRFLGFVKNLLIHNKFVGKA